MSKGDNGQFRFGEYVLDVPRRSLIRSGEPLTLNPKSFDLLCELVKNSGEVVSKDDLLTRVWPDQFVEENNLSVQVSALRKLLGDGNGSGKFIATVPGKGYSFVAELDRDDEIVIEHKAVERLIVERIAPREIQSSVMPKRNAAFAIIAIIVIATGSYLGYRYLAKPTPNVSSIAVLPFANETADPNNEYLTDGLAESVMYSLSRMPELRVMSRGSVFRYKGKDKDAKAIGSELNVNAVLTGRVTQRGDAINISAELVSAADNTVIWGEQFTRKVADIEKFQTDIAASISSRLRFKLTGRNPRMTENAEAYRLYLQALHYWNKRTPDNIAKSIDLFKLSIVQDPQFSRAYGGLAMAYEVQFANTSSTPDEQKEIFARIRETTSKAIEMDEDLPEAYAVLGAIKLRDWDFQGSEAAFRRAIELNPNFSTAHQWYSQFLSFMGRHDEASVEINKAYELDPFSRAILMNIGLRHFSAGRTDEAIAQFKSLIDSDPDYAMPYLFLASAYKDKGMYLESLEMTCTADVMLRVSSAEECQKEIEVLRKAFERSGEAGFWKEYVKWTAKLYERGLVDIVEYAEDEYRAGNKDKAFELLEKAFKEHHPVLVSIQAAPPNREIVSDPRFKVLLRRIGLAR